MKLPIIRHADIDFANKRLEQTYKQNSLPKEKKTYLPEHEKSIGPYMACETKDGPRYFLDAASQIATLGLGFNALPFFGASHFLESWTNDPHSQDFFYLRKSYRKFLEEKSSIQNVAIHFSHSGAEANEVALGESYFIRKNPSAKKVLAFKGSFHGRMMVALSSTWNPSKREPFEWEEFKTLYASYPHFETCENLNARPEKWSEKWEYSGEKSFTPPSSWSENKSWASVVSSLIEVREQFCEGHIFSLIIEPMQCEGGDNYAPAAFYEALLIMGKIFGISIIFDEVQTGFHLGDDFFWHKTFNCQDSKGKRLSPDYIVCAKKAQLGLVLSKHPFTMKEEFCVASAIRGHAHALFLDQYSQRIKEIGQRSLKMAEDFCEKYSQISNPRGSGLSFAFDVETPSLSADFVKHRFSQGLLFYPAGSKTLRFRTNTAFTDQDLDFLFQGLTNIADFLLKGKPLTTPQFAKTKKRDIDNIYLWQKMMINFKKDGLLQNLPSLSSQWEKILEKFQLPDGCKVIFFDSHTFDKYWPKIEALQKSIYEPARQTSKSIFEQTAKDAINLSMGIEKEGKLLACAFASPLKNYPLEKGVRKDPYFSNPRCLYMVDVTVDKDLQGLGMGRKLKYALSAIATLKGVERINGRNRNKMAAPMFSINLSLGARLIDSIKEDYLDFEGNRDVNYYSCTSKWVAPTSLMGMKYSPLHSSDLSSWDIAEKISTMTNKLCLSNFVSRSFLDNIDSIWKQIPSELAQGHTTSGQSECVDKIVKSLRIAGVKGSELLTFSGHYFGEGSFLARSLSNKTDPFFKVTRLPHPDKENSQKVLSSLEAHLLENQVLGIFLEPVPQNMQGHVPKYFLKALKSLANKLNVPLIYNETSSGFYRYDDFFWAANDPELTPDALMQYCGGQMGLVHISQKYFLETPLMMISTWDGDEISLARFTHMMEKTILNKKQVLETYQKFEEKITALATQYFHGKSFLHRGQGRLYGALPLALQEKIESYHDYFILRPTTGEMNHFLGEK